MCRSTPLVACCCVHLDLSCTAGVQKHQVSCSMYQKGKVQAEVDEVLGQLPVQHRRAVADVIRRASQGSLPASSPRCPCPPSIPPSLAYAHLLLALALPLTACFLSTRRCPKLWIHSAGIIAGQDPILSDAVALQGPAAGVLGQGGQNVF